MKNDMEKGERLTTKEVDNILIDLNNSDWTNWVLEYGNMIFLSDNPKLVSVTFSRDVKSSDYKALSNLIRSSHSKNNGILPAKGGDTVYLQKIKGDLNNISNFK